MKRPREPFKGYNEELKKRSREKWIEPHENLKERKRILKSLMPISLKERRTCVESPKRIKMKPYKVAHSTNLKTASKTANAIEFAVELLKMNKKIKPDENILIKNIGFGFNFKDIKEVHASRGTYEPFLIADELEKTGKKYEINSFALNPKEVEEARGQRVLHYLPIDSSKKGIWKRIPKKILNKIKFNQLDIITETPAKQADITVMKGIPTVNDRLHPSDPRRMVMLKNAIDSTKKKGYIVCTLDSEYETKICKQFGLKQIDKNVYQKL